jgi:hypothetical protein
MVGSFSKSGVATAALFDSEVKDEEITNMLSLTSPNATRWLGLHRQARRNRELQPNLSMALCGDSTGLEEEDDAMSEASEGNANSVSSGSSRSGQEEREEKEEEGSSDDERVASNVSKDKAFPLKHRLLNNSQFNLNNQWETVLATPAETSAVLQSHDGTRLDEAHLILVAAVEQAEATRLQVVLYL